MTDENSKKQPMSDLIAHLEAASEGNNFLDLAIMIQINKADARNNTKAPHYTTSIESALSALPKGCYPTILSWNSMGGETGYCRITVRGPFGRNGWHEDRKGKGKTPALAICIAALKAYEALKARKVAS